MKRFKLPKGARAQIKCWLALPDTGLKGETRYGACPFITDPSICCDDVCKKAFPRVRPANSTCPCHEYTLSHVIKRAKEIIR